jgi:eukaryotic-like serine/threonine-protein kinase
MNEKQNPNMQVLTGQLGQYRIVGPIEQGRFSKAYLGEHVQHPSKPLVIELFPIRLTPDESMRFRQSGNALMQLVHPSILRLIDIGMENMRPFIVLDSVPHTPLRQLYLRGQGQPLEKLLPYLRQVAIALEFAHTHGRIHKHLRPDNVLLGLGSNYTIYLCDFAIDGIDKNEHFQNYQRSMLPLEPLTYMAPEQIRQQPVNASDQYALGTMVYEWLCGTPPFVGNPSDIAQQQLYSTPPSVRQKAPGISPDVEQMVMMALAKEPGKRFANVPEFVKALEHASELRKPRDQRGPSIPVSGHPIPPPVVPITPAPQKVSVSPIEVLNPSEAQPLLAPNSLSSTVPSTPPLAKRQGTPSNPKRRAFLVSAAGVAVVGGVGAWLFYNKTHPATTTPPANQTNGTTPAIVSSGQPLVYNAHTARVNAVAWSPDGKSVASASDDKLVLICDSNGKTLLTYSGHQGRVNAVAWSPDSTMIASASADKTVQVWEAATGNRIFAYTGHTDAVNAVSWYPDPNDDRLFIASGGDDRTVQAWFASTGSHFLTYAKHQAPVSGVAWSPDKKKIASSSWDNTVHVISTIPTEAFAIGGTIILSNVHGSKAVYTVAWSPDGESIVSAGNDNLVLVINSTNGKPVSGYAKMKHEKAIRTVAWSPDGQFIASGGDDNMAYVWDATNGSPRVTFAKHTNSVLALDWSPDSTMIASASADNTVQMWKSS